MTTRYFLATILCLSSLGCRTVDSPPRQDSASSAEESPALHSRAEPMAGEIVVFAYYFHRSFRCYSCLALETNAERAIREHFARQRQNGQVVWMPVNDEDPATRALQQQFDVRSNGVVLARMENGMCTDSKRMDELWGLLNRPEVFSQYLVDEIHTRLTPVQGR